MYNAFFIGLFCIPRKYAKSLHNLHYFITLKCRAELNHGILYFSVSAAKVIMCCLISRVRSISSTFFSLIWDQDYKIGDCHSLIMSGNGNKKLHDMLLISVRHPRGLRNKPNLQKLRSKNRGNENFLKIHITF
jgi:hypothetical protein